MIINPYPPDKGNEKKENIMTQKNRKKARWLTLPLCLLMLISAVSLSAFRKQPGVIKISLSAGSQYQKARLDLNGKFRGYVYRNRIKKFVVLFPEATRHYPVKIKVYSGAAAVRKTIFMKQARVRTVVLTLRKKETEARTGTIHVGLMDDSTVRRARIYINKRFRRSIKRGDQVRFQLQKGRYTIHLRAGKISRTRRVTLRGGDSKEAHFTLKKRVQYGQVRIRLSSNSGVPTARLYINNKFRGILNRGEMKSMRLKADRYNIELRRGGKRMEKTVQVKDGRTTSRTFTFPRRRKATLKIRLSFDSEVQQARLYINDDYKRTIRKGRHYTYHLRHGIHRIRVVGEGLRSRKTIALSRGENRTLRLSLREEKGWLRIRLKSISQANMARLYINGRYRGKLRRGRSRSYQLKAGAHRLTLRRTGKILRKEFTIRASRSTFLSLRFPKPEQGKLMITHSRRSRHQRGGIYINGVYQKQLRRGDSMTVVRKAGSYRISMRYRNRRVRRTVTITAGSIQEIILRFRRRGGRYGYLIIAYPEDSRHESARLYINKRFYGTLWQGDRRRIRTRAGVTKVELKAGEETETRLVTIERRRTRTITIGFKGVSRMGRIRVYHSRSSTVKSALLRINGKRKGYLKRGTDSSYTVEAGRYTITLGRGARKARRRVTVKPGRVSLVGMRIGEELLEQEKGTIAISLTGSFQWAKVYINTRYRGRVYKNKQLKLRLPSGFRYTVKVARDDMQSSATRRVYLRTGSTKRVPFNLIFIE